MFDAYLDHCFRDFRGWYDGECGDHPIGIFLKYSHERANGGDNYDTTSRNFDNNKEPRPAPVPPPNE